MLVATLDLLLVRSCVGLFPDRGFKLKYSRRDAGDFGV
jgi:hypothetical protein